LWGSDRQRDGLGGGAGTELGGGKGILEVGGKGRSPGTQKALGSGWAGCHGKKKPTKNGGSDVPTEKFVRNREKDQRGSKGALHKKRLWSISLTVEKKTEKQQKSREGVWKKISQ